MKMKRKPCNYKDLDMSEIFQNLENELVDNFPSDSNCSDLVAYYEESITRILDKHCPRMCCVRLRVPCYNQMIHEARWIRRRSKDKWRKSRLEVDKQIFLESKKVIV